MSAPPVMTQPAYRSSSFYGGMETGALQMTEGRRATQTAYTPTEPGGGGGVPLRHVDAGPVPLTSNFFTRHPPFRNDRTPNVVIPFDSSVSSNTTSEKLDMSSPTYTEQPVLAPNRYTSTSSDRSASPPLQSPLYSPLHYPNGQLEENAILRAEIIRLREEQRLQHQWDAMTMSELPPSYPVRSRPSSTSS